MSNLAIVFFLAIFGLLLFAIGFGLRFYEGQRRKKLVSMLRTVTENGREQQVNLLIEDKAKKDELQELLESLNITERLTKLLSESGVNWAIDRLAIGMIITAIAGAFIGTKIPLEFPVVLKSLVAALFGGYLPIMFLSKKRSARINALESQLPEALDFLSRSMRAGHAFTISLDMVGQELHDPLGQEFRTLFNELNLGASLDRAFASFCKRVPIPDVRFFSSAVLLQRQTGGNLSEILNRLSLIIRERFRLKAQVKAVSAHGRMTATILTVLPIATLGGMMVTSPGYLDPMTSTPVGRQILGAGIMSVFIGNFFIRKIVKIKV